MQKWPSMTSFISARDLSKDATCVENESDVDQDDFDMEDSTFHWEEEATLFSELMGDG